jgi:hypothetical protein
VIELVWIRIIGPALRKRAYCRKVDKCGEVCPFKVSDLILIVVFAPLP